MSVAPARSSLLAVRTDDTFSGTRSSFAVLLTSLSSGR